MQEEIWKDVKGYEGLYKISNSGRVKSIGRSGSGCSIEDKILKNRIDGKGYYFVTLCISGKKEQIRVHQLVGIAFVHNPEKLPVINHKDEIKTNNYYKNLEWTTHRYNINYSVSKKSSSKYFGVHWCNTRKRWISKVRIDGRQKRIGQFKNEIDAANSYIDFCKDNNLT